MIPKLVSQSEFENKKGIREKRGKEEKIRGIREKEIIVYYLLT